MVNTRFTPVRALVAFGFCCALTSCTTPDKYKLALGEVAPPPRLDYRQLEPTAELTVKSVIVCKGPGSWKQDARWDEYQVRVTNLSQQLLRIESAALVDFQGQAQPTGWDPWQLESQSTMNWDVYRAGGTQLRAGAGATELKSGTESVASADAVLRGAALHDVVPAEFVHDTKPTPSAHGGEKDKVAREFARRRLFLPVTMPPGGMIEGSLFFPMTPGPQRLVLRGRYGDAPVVLTLELQPMAALHLKPPGEPDEQEYTKRFWSWLQKSWDSAFSSTPTAKVEK